MLVAVDGSATSLFALRHAVRAVREDRARLTVLRVVPEPSSAVTLAGLSPAALLAEMEAEAERDLRELVAGLPDDVSVTTLVRHGDPAHEILTVLRSAPFDLLCLGARGVGRVEGLLLGSVSAALMRVSPVPVAVLHPPAGR